MRSLVLARNTINLKNLRLLTRPAQLNLTTSCTNSEAKESKAKTKAKNKMDEFSKTNPYFAKYETKLKTMYNENPEHFLNTLSNRKAERIEEADKYEEEIRKAQMAISLTKKKKLDSIMKIELVENHPVEDIKTIWETYMQERGRLASVLTTTDYEQIRTRSTKFPTFLFPLPRQEGYEFIMAQWSNNECHFTPLINFQAHGENAPSIMTVIYFDELAQKKQQVVLEMAELDANNLKMEEAKFLIHQLKSYYLSAKEESDEKYKILNTFTNAPREFKHVDLIKQVESDNLKLDQFK